MTKIHIVPVLRDNYCYVVEGDNAQAVIIDPGQVGPVEIFIRQNNLVPVLILNTHHHADHVAGNAELSRLYNIPVKGPKAEEKLIPQMSAGLTHGDTVSLAGLVFEVIATPGHTSGHVSYYERSSGSLFSGDTLFSMGCGRLIEGSAAEMYRSLQRLKELPGKTHIYCGHEYTEANGRFGLSQEPENSDIAERMNTVRKLRGNNLPTLPVTLETEMKTNVFLRAISEKDFADLRARKDVFQ